MEICQSSLRRNLLSEWNLTKNVHTLEFSHNNTWTRTEWYQLRLEKHVKFESSLALTVFRIHIITNTKYVQIASSPNDDWLRGSSKRSTQKNVPVFVSYWATLVVIEYIKAYFISKQMIKMSNHLPSLRYT